METAFTNGIALLFSLSLVGGVDTEQGKSLLTQKLHGTRILPLLTIIIPTCFLITRQITK